MHIHILYPSSASLISCEINHISQETDRAEHKYIEYGHPATRLHCEVKYCFNFRENSSTLPVTSKINILDIQCNIDRAM